MELEQCSQHHLGLFLDRNYIIYEQQRGRVPLFFDVIFTTHELI